MNGPVVATVLTASRAAGARVLAESLERHHPGVPLVGALIGPPPPDGLPFPTVPAEALGTLGGDDVMAIACALKPALIAHLLDAGHPSVLYLDPDQWLLAPVADVLERVAAHAMVLTPHLVRPHDAGRELMVLVAGAYNAGLVGCADRPETRRFLAFWNDRIRRHPVAAVDRGLNYDQRWLDLAPGHLDDLHILRAPDINVGHWRLPVEVPPRLMHFSGFDPERPGRVSAYSDGPPGALAPLLEAYARALRGAGWEETRSLPWR
jgi:hypothetical protein